MRTFSTPGSVSMPSMKAYSSWPGRKSHMSILQISHPPSASLQAARSTDNVTLTSKRTDEDDVLCAALHERATAGFRHAVLAQIRKARHPSQLTTNTAPSGSFESRTATAEPSWATSTQLPELPE